MTAGIAANRPNAVAIKASAMPGATARKVAVLALARPANEVITPQTVPNSPTNGVTDAVVARKFMRFSTRVSCAAEERWIARCRVAIDRLPALSAAALNTPTSGVNRRASHAVLISERLLPRRKIFQKVSDSLLILRRSSVLERMIPQDQIEKISKTKRTNRVIGVVWLKTSIKLIPVKFVSSSIKKV